jgi:uncharacterized protein YbaR (Trm112 family)
MKKDLMDIICCPTCKGDLVLEIAKEEAEEVVEGNLKCSACNVSYPIEDSIPNLLPQK